MRRAHRPRPPPSPLGRSPRPPIRRGREPRRDRGGGRAAHRLHRRTERRRRDRHHPRPTSFVLHEGAVPAHRVVAARRAGEGASAVVETFARQARAATGSSCPSSRASRRHPTSRSWSPTASLPTAPEGYTLESGDGGVRVAAMFRARDSSAAPSRCGSCAPAAIERADAATAPDGGWIVPGIRRGRPALRLPGRHARRRPALLPVEDVLATSTPSRSCSTCCTCTSPTTRCWRIRIDSWPELTGVGASTSVGGDGGGSYTKDDYRRIVEYAAERFITIVPEIDLPGHTNAALSAYPELNPRRRRTRAVRGRRGRLLVALRLARASRGDRPVPGRRHARARRAHARTVAALGGDESLSTSRDDYLDPCGGSPGRRRDRQDGHRVVDGRLAGAARRHRGAVLELRRARGRRGGARPLVRRAGRQRDPLPADVAYLDMKYVDDPQNASATRSASTGRRGRPRSTRRTSGNRRRSSRASTSGHPASRRRSGPRRSRRSRTWSSWRSPG